MPKTTHIIEPAVDDDGGVAQNRGKAEQIVLDLLGTLWSTGGIVRIVADRVKLGELPAAPGQRPEPIAETVGLVIEYGTSAPLNRQSITTDLLNTVYGAEQEPEPPAAPLEEALQVDAPDETEDDAGDDEDDGIDGIPDDEEG